jgi:hypothetical protein
MFGIEIVSVVWRFEGPWRIGDWIVVWSQVRGVGAWLLEHQLAISIFSGAYFGFPP